MGRRKSATNLVGMTATLVVGVWMAHGVARARQAPPVPAAAPIADSPAATDDVTVLQLQEQIRQLEAIVRASAERQQALEARLSEMEAGGVVTAAPAAPSTGGVTARGTTAAAPTTGDGFGEMELQRGGAAGLGATAPLEVVADMPPPPRTYAPKLKVGPGFQLSDEDEEFLIQFHNLTQADGRFYQQGAQQTTRDTFGIPRQWFIFNGRVGKPFEYYVAFAEGFDNLNLLDSFLNVHFDDRFQIKVGRFKTPYTYEFYSMPVQGLLTPERSVFFNNFGLNREVGVMAWGELFGGRLDYAAGVFNGARNSFVDLQDGKNFAALFNTRPFEMSGSDLLQFLNFGGSVNVGKQNQPVLPNTLRVEVPTTGNSGIGVPFLVFNNNVIESGTRALWSLHAAWYYRHLSLIGEWQSGYQNYAFNNHPLDRSQVGVQSFYVWAGYFLTGETVESRGMVRPLRPFDLRKGKLGPGAVELVGRYNYLDIGNNIFTDGFANPNNWADRLYTVDVGVNWYWNQYVKVFAGWEHAVFGNPVLFRSSPNSEYQLTSDLFWFRVQLYF